MTRAGFCGYDCAGAFAVGLACIYTLRSMFLASLGLQSYAPIELGLCRRRGWQDPSYECYRDPSGYTCLVLVNGREYQTDLAYESNSLAQENAAMRAFMVCRNFSVNGGMLARNGIVQGLPANGSGGRKKSRHASASHTHGHSHRESRHGHRSGHSSSSSTVSFE
ncbi:hypothetical protein NUW58_g8244 [Xylaria curta]|uniref:Uncharacterized protein n=1 Tax=Xylaria curta TaxID=42375 RepID=A0ACC1NAP0_9PEZI|nr:hypothetical protein NUW58_g8244 [Xylaria curta]